MIPFRFKSILFAFTMTFTLSVSAGVFDQDIDIQKIFNPTEIWKYDVIFLPGMNYQTANLESLLHNALYRRREFDEPLKSGDYKLLTGSQCQFLKPDHPVENFAARTCLGFLNKEPDSVANILNWVLFENNMVLETYRGFPARPVKAVGFNSSLLIEVREDRPIFQKKAALSEVPLACLNGVMAIEDNRFLEHQGVSVTGMLRAFLKNIFLGRKAQGGSTITQQLVKNNFLSHEKTYSRKIREIILSLRLESKYTKDEILEAYVNIVYMGQRGVWEVHGFSAAAEHYFGKRIQDLNVPECAFIAGVLNNPGIFNPWKNHDRALKRRDAVLNKMKEFNLISDGDYDSAIKDPLTPAPLQETRRTVPYFAQAAISQIKSLGVPLEGLQIFLSLQPSWQEEAQKSFESSILKFKEKKPKLNLDGAYVAGDNRSGLVTMAFGGIDFAKTPFNRVTEAKRLVGSTIKPFLYLLALKKGKDPFTTLKDEPIEIKLDNKNVWRPQNYEKDTLGDIPLHVALEKSQNLSTVYLANEIGFKDFYDFLGQFNVPLPQTMGPATVLGAVDLRPLDVLKMYMTLARNGKMVTPLFFSDLYKDGKDVFADHPEWTAVKEISDEPPVVQIDAILERVLTHGTGAGMKSYTKDCLLAGKTGTTSDYRDSWFSGMTPQITAISWLGDDANRSTGFTGASGAAQIWAPITGKLCQYYPKTEWQMPEGYSFEIKDDVRVLKKN